jgi:hypothetical protein
VWALTSLLRVSSAPGPGPLQRAALALFCACPTSENSSSRKLFGKSRRWRLGRTFHRSATAKWASLPFLSTHGGATMDAIRNFQTVSLGTSVNKRPSRAGVRHRPKADRNSTEAGDHRLASQLDGLGGAEHPSRRVFGSHGDVGLGGLHQHGSLEAVTGGRSQGL